MDFFSTGIVVQRGLCCRGIGSMEVVQEFPWMDALSSGGLNKGRDDAVGFYPLVRSCSEADLSGDHDLAQ